MLATLCAKVQGTVQDLTHKGHCTMCGGCCPNLLPLSVSEIETIRAYVAEHGIKPEAGDACPFLNAERMCNVYEVRPLICRLFKCNRPKPPFKHTQLMAKEDREVMNVRTTFFN